VLVSTPQRERERIAVAETSCCLLICRDGKSNPDTELRQINATGKSFLIFRNESQAPKSKIFCFAPNPNQMHIQTVPFPLEGRIAIVTDVGDGMRWTRGRQAREQQSQGEMNLVSEMRRAG
jgi:hypothetical protein